MPSASMTRPAERAAARRSRASSMRLVVTNCGEIQRVRIASSTFG